MIWLSYPVFSFISMIAFIGGIILIYVSEKKAGLRLAGNFFLSAGIMSILLFIVVLWFFLNRPPFKTTGETRLWHSFFLLLIGYITYRRWNVKWFLVYCAGMSAVFQLLNLFNPETYDKTLSPALQSIWYVPHVLVYISGYALLTGSALMAIHGIYRLNRNSFDISILKRADNLVYMGFAFLTLGLLFGALWAREAWGHYWTWDPKETWAFLTWLGYLSYIHIRWHLPAKVAAPLWMLGLAFIILLVAWFGINYLPTARNSVHVYNN